MSSARRQDVPHVEKVRRLFDEMTKDGHMVSLEGFTTTLQRCKVGLPTEAVHDLFRNAAVSNEVMMTFAEFQTWAEQYPTVLDCVYYRLMDTAEDMRQQQRMRELQELLEGAQSATRDADARHRAAVASLEEFRDVVNAAERRLGDAGEAEMSAKRRLDEYRERTAAQRQRVRDQQLALSRSRDEERQWHYRMQAAQSDTKGALSVLRQAEAKLHELQVELERHSAGVNAAKEAVSAAYDREAQLAQEADAAVRKIQDIERSFGSLEDDVQHAAVTEQGALDDYRRTAHDVLIAHEALEKATVQLKGSADVVFAAAAAVDGAAAHEKDVGSQLGALQHGIANFTAHRLTTNEEECHLMAEEVALRRQRQALETREAHLRSTHQRSYKASLSPLRVPQPVGRAQYITETHSPIINTTYPAAVPASVPQPAYTHTSPRDFLHMSQATRYDSYTCPRSPSRWSSPHPPPDFGHSSSTYAAAGAASTGANRMYRRDRDPVDSPYAPGSANNYDRYVSKRVQNQPMPLPRTERPSSIPSSSSSGSFAAPLAPSQRDTTTVSAERTSKILHDAMKGFGTDEDAIYDALRNVRTNGEWAEIRSAFKRNHASVHKGDLLMAMRDDLTKKEFARCGKILSDNGIIIHG